MFVVGCVTKKLFRKNAGFVLFCVHSKQAKKERKVRTEEAYCVITCARKKKQSSYGDFGAHTRKSCKRELISLTPFKIKLISVGRGQCFLSIIIPSLDEISP